MLKWSLVTFAESSGVSKSKRELQKEKLSVENTSRVFRSKGELQIKERMKIGVDGSINVVPQLCSGLNLFSDLSAVLSSAPNTECQVSG